MKSATNKHEPIKRESARIKLNLTRQDWTVLARGARVNRLTLDQAASFIVGHGLDLGTWEQNQFSLGVVL